MRIPSMTARAATEVSSSSQSFGLPAPIRTQSRFLLLLFCWFASQAVVRTLISPTANLDEAEQLMLTQDWALGYGPQPPLYTWLQAALFGVTGVSIASLAVLKNALLFLTYTLAYLNGRLITGRHETGLVAALSLFLIPQIAWESQRDLTHSVLASMLSLLTLYCVLKVVRSGGLGRFLCLGAVLALGAMAKYNYLLWAAGLLLAACSLRSWQSALLNWRMTMALAAALILVVPHVLWAVNNQARVTQTASDFGMNDLDDGDSSGPEPEKNSALLFLQTRALGMLEFVWAVTRFLAPLVGIHLALLLWDRRLKRRDGFLPEHICPGRRDCPIETRIILRALGIIAVLLVVAVLVLGPTSFKDRWFQPILVSVPVLLAISPFQPWCERSFRWLWRVCVVVMLTVAVLIPGKVLFADLGNQRERLNMPLLELGRLLDAQLPADTVILADTPFIAGNMRLAMPNRRIISKLWGDSMGQSCCLLWDMRKHPSVPRALLKAAQGQISPDATPMVLSAPYRGQRSQVYSLGALW